MKEISAEVTSNPADMLRKYLKRLPQETVDPTVYRHLDEWARWLAENADYPPSSGRLCTICGTPIPEARLELTPNTVTCSKAHSIQHHKNLGAAASKRHRARQKAMRESPEP